MGARGQKPSYGGQRRSSFQAESFSSVVGISPGGTVLNKNFVMPSKYFAICVSGELRGKSVEIYKRKNNDVIANGFGMSFQF